MKFRGFQYNMSIFLKKAIKIDRLWHGFKMCSSCSLKMAKRKTSWKNSFECKNRHNPEDDMRATITSTSYTARPVFIEACEELSPPAYLTIVERGIHWQSCQWVFTFGKSTTTWATRDCLSPPSRVRHRGHLRVVASYDFGDLFL